MKNKIYILSVFIGIVLVNSCSTKLEVVVKDAKPFPVIFGFLDAKYKKQYIKITKAFLGKTNEEILAISNDPKFNYYVPSEIISANIQRAKIIGKDTLYFESYPLSPDFYPASQDGYFKIVLDSLQKGEFKNNGFFSFEFPKEPYLDSNLTNNIIYKLQVKTSNGIVAESFTPLIYSRFGDSTTIDFGAPSNILVANKTSFLINDLGIPLFQSNKVSSDNPKLINFDFLPSFNAYDYQLYYIFPVEEFNNDKVTLNRRYNLDLDFGKVKPDISFLNNKLEININGIVRPPKIFGYDFYLALLTELKQLNNKQAKKLKRGAFFVYGIGQDLEIYLRLNNGKFGFSLDKPSYSNVTLIENGKKRKGLGVLSTYTSNNRIVVNRLNPQSTKAERFVYYNYKFSANSQTALIADPALQAVGLYQME